MIELLPRPEWHQHAGTLPQHSWMMFVAPEIHIEPRSRIGSASQTLSSARSASRTTSSATGFPRPWSNIMADTADHAFPLRAIERDSADAEPITVKDAAIEALVDLICRNRPAA